MKQLIWQVKLLSSLHMDLEIASSLADLFGRLNALLIVSLIGIMIGYLVLLSIISDSGSFSLTLSRLEKERGQRIILDRLAKEQL